MGKEECAKCWDVVERSESKQCSTCKDDTIYCNDCFQDHYKNCHSDSEPMRKYKKMISLDLYKLNSLDFTKVHDGNKFYKKLEGLINCQEFDEYSEYN